MPELSLHRRAIFGSHNLLLVELWLSVAYVPRTSNKILHFTTHNYPSLSVWLPMRVKKNHSSLTVGGFSQPYHHSLTNVSNYILHEGEL